MKRWLRGLAEQRWFAELTVVAENLDERVQRQHVVGQQRRRAVQNGGCGSRT